MQIGRASMIAFGLFFVLSSAYAEKDQAANKQEEAAKPAQRTPGYQGVTLHGGQPPPQTPPASGLQAITWPGFRMHPTKVEVFLQLTGAVKYRLRQTGLKAFVDLHKVQVNLRTNMLGIDTSHFKGNVASFRVRPLKRDRARLEISFKHKSRARAEIRSVGQYTYLVVTVPTTKINKAKPKSKEESEYDDVDEDYESDEVGE